MNGSTARMPSSASITAPKGGGVGKTISVTEMWRSGRNLEIENRSRAFSEASMVIKKEKLKKSGARYRICQCVDVLVITACLLISWGLLSLPIVFFFTDPDEVCITIMTLIHPTTVFYHQFNVKQLLISIECIFCLAKGGVFAPFHHSKLNFLATQNQPFYCPSSSI